jgi:hypothetical protein
MRLIVLVCAVASLVACGGRGSPVTQLEGIDDLQAAFNADHGEARLILLLSPS